MAKAKKSKSDETIVKVRENEKEQEIKSDGAESFSLKDCLALLPLSPEENKEIASSNDLKSSLERHIRRLEQAVDEVLDTAEEEISELKARYLGLEHSLPVNPLKESRVIVLDMDYNTFLDELNSKTPRQVINETYIGEAIVTNNVFTGELLNRSLVGLYIDFPFGASGKAEQKRELAALEILAEVAFQNLTHVFFSTDPRKILNLEKFSQLPDRMDDFLDSYQDSFLYKTIKGKWKEHLQMRCTNLLNYFLNDTERLESYYQSGYTPSADNKRFRDIASWSSSLYAMLQQLTSNYDKYGWANTIMGKGSLQSVPQYQNPQPKSYRVGATMGAKHDFKYTLTLFDLPGEYRAGDLSKLGFTTLRREILEESQQDGTDKISEYISFNDAQTLLKRNHNDTTSPNNYHNYLGNRLLEDAIRRDLVLICRDYIGKPSSSRNNIPGLRPRIDRYLNSLLQGEGLAEATRPLESYEIIECKMKGEQAAVTVKILPLAIIREVVIDVSGLDSDGSILAGAQGGKNKNA